MPPRPHAPPAALALVLLVASGVAGCAASGTLVAEDGSRRLTARDPGGVTVVLTSGAWKGSPTALPEQWTVLHVLVANLGTTPVLLAPGDLELRDERGFRYELYDVGGAFERLEPASASPDEASTWASYDRVDHPDRPYDRHYDPGGPVEFEPIVAPGDVPAQALPWGVLEPGTQMRGFLYFERVEGTANAATLTWHLTDPSHVPVVDLRFPLWVARPPRARTRDG